MAASSYSWVTGSSGNWSTAADWTRFSGAGTAPPVAGDLAELLTTGTITFTGTGTGESDAAANFLIDKAGAGVLVNLNTGTLAISSTTSLVAGTLLATGGTLTTGALQATGGLITDGTSGSIKVTNAATIGATTFNITSGGLFTDTSGSLLLNAAGSTLNNSGTGSITNLTTVSGTGAVLKNAGGVFNTGSLGMTGGQFQQAAAGTLNVTGVSATAVDIVTGNTGRGIASLTGVFTDAGGVTVTTGEFVDDAATTITGTAAFATGASTVITLGGAAAPVINAGTVLITGSGNATMNNGSLAISQATGSVSVGSGSTLTLSGGTIVATNGGVNDASIITGTGLITGGTISGAGTVTAGAGTLSLTDVDKSALAVSNNASSILNLGAADSSVQVTFGGATGALELSDFTTGTPDSVNFTTSTIVAMNVNSAVAATNEIILSGPTESGVTATYTPTTTTSGSLSISDSSGVVTTISLTGLTGTTSGSEFANWSGSGTTTDIWLSNAVCFGAGTQILTTRGEVAVEALAEGDLVVTHTGEQRPIKWLGYRRLDLTRHGQPNLAAPVRVRRGAFGENMPRRDLIVSPDHCMFVDGKLIPAKLLINEMSIVQERDTRVVEYYHVELDRHAVLLAEGLPAESYLDTGNRAFFSNAGLALVLHPEFHVNAGLRCWETDACAPLAVSAEAVEPVWRTLASRAENFGYAKPAIATTEEADLRLVANGRSVRPVSADRGCHVFVLPPGTSAVQLASRASAPSDVVPYLEDWRQLGVAVSRIVVRSSTEQTEIPADHPALTQGWHAVEHEGAALWRWTDGNARLPIAMSTEPLTVEVHVRQTGTYRLDTAEPKRLVA